jgi:ornithine carbamoyltransferase
MSGPLKLLRVLDLDRPTLDEILGCAAVMKSDRQRYLGALEREMMIGVFARPSTRTRMAFAAAAHGLGLLPFFVNNERLQLARGEEVADTGRSLSSYAALVVAGLPSHARLKALATAATVPVVTHCPTATIPARRSRPCSRFASTSAALTAYASRTSATATTSRTR